MPPFVSFIVVTWNGKNLLEKCLPSIFSQSYQDYEILVVDNGSQDGTVDWLSHQYPQVRIIALHSNLGFAEPNNLAFKEAKGTYIATINNDLVLHPDWLRNLVAALEQNENCFAAQGKILRDDEPDKIDTCGLGIRACGAARNLAHNKNTNSLMNQRSIFTVSAGAALYRNKTIAELGYFDSDYFAYYEDLDLGWRARIHGLEAVFVPESIAYHKIHGTSGSMEGSFLWFLSERNRLRTLIKNLPLTVLLRHPLTMTLDELRYIDMIRKKAGWKTLLKARISVLKDFFSLLQKRPKELKQLTAQQWQQWLSLSKE